MYDDGSFVFVVQDDNNNKKCLFYSSRQLVRNIGVFFFKKIFSSFGNKNTNDIIDLVWSIDVRLLS